VGSGRGAALPAAGPRLGFGVPVRPRVVVGVVWGGLLVGARVVGVGYALAHGVLQAFSTGACPGDSDSKQLLLARAD
jgi:hypothetical protein